MLQARHLRLATRFVRHRFEDLHPYEVQAVLLNACNLKCEYCCCPELKTSLLTTAQWLAVVERLGELGTLRLKWQGGEPTLRNDFGELCRAVRRAGIVCAVVTNGTQIAERPELLDDMDEVVFSLDAVTPEINDAARGAGVHAQVMRAIEHARRRPLRLYINMVVTQRNLHEVDAMLRFCEERGIGLNAQPVSFGASYYDEGARAVVPHEDEIRNLYRQMAEWKRQNRPLMFAVSTYEKATLWRDYNTLSRRSDAVCAMGRFYVHIEPNGNVHPCVQHSADFQPKNVVYDGLEEALRHVRRHNCGDCYSAYLNERKALFSLRPQALWEFARRS